MVEIYKTSSGFEWEVHPKGKGYIKRAGEWGDRPYLTRNLAPEGRQAWVTVDSEKEAEAFDAGLSLLHAALGGRVAPDYNAYAAGWEARRRFR